jgi:hypothetical protein
VGWTCPPPPPPAAARLLATHLGAGGIEPGEAVHATLARPLVAALASA